MKQRASYLSKFLILPAVTSVATLALLFSANAMAMGPSCSHVAEHDLNHPTTENEVRLDRSLHGTWQERRQAVFDFLKRNPQIPAYQKMTEHGLVPVVLINAETYSSVNPLIERSVGYGVELKPEAGDHGLLRLEDDMIDFGVPEQRKGPNNPELNRTGIAWKKIDSMLTWRRVIVQNSYLMPKIDRHIVKYYHAVRRAGLFRTRYGWLQDHEVDRSVLNLFPEVIENCYGYCKTDSTEQMLAEFNGQMIKHVGPHWKEIVATHQGQEFLKAARAKLMNADAYDPPALQWKSVEPYFHDTGLAALMPEHLNQVDREIVMNLIVSDDAVRSYASLMRHYEVSNHHGLNDLETEPVSFLFVLADPSVTDAFRAGHFSSPGSYFSLNADGQSPLNP